MSRLSIPTISSVVSKVTGKIFKDRGVHILKIIEDWDIIIGQQWKDSIFPCKIVWDNNNYATLYLYCKNSLVINLATHDSKNIIDKINQYFGYKCVVKVRFKKN